MVAARFAGPIIQGEWAGMVNGEPAIGTLITIIAMAALEDCCVIDAMLQ